MTALSGFLRLAGVATVLLAVSPSAMRAAEGDPLAAGFRRPPLEARPGVYWDWLNGSVNLPQLTRDLEAMKAIGLRGADIFDVGAVNSPRYHYRLYPLSENDDVVPEGPPFLGPESVKAIGHAVREAGRLGLELSLITSSSYNAGGPWIEPENANMGLYCSVTTVEGPTDFDAALPFPPVPESVPRGTDGLPVWSKDVALLAMPHRVLSGYGFIIQVAPPSPQTIDRVVLHNTRTDDPKRFGGQDLFAKDFVVSVSTTTTAGSAFKEVLRGSLKPETGPQSFRFQPAEARYVKLRILSGHNPKSDLAELGEFEAYSPKGVNVVAKYDADAKPSGAKLLAFTSQTAEADAAWNAGNVHDGALDGPGGSWRSGQPPRAIEGMQSIVDLAPHRTPDGHIRWRVPEGAWDLVRFVCTNTGQHLIVPSPKSDGLMLDHFHAPATEYHLLHIIKKLQAELGVERFDDTALRTMYMCSYEPHGTRTWTGEFLEEFRRRRGYDPTPYLPLLKGWLPVRDAAIRARFLYDYNRVVADLLVDAHYRQARETSNKYGLLLCAEAGGPGGPVEALKALGALDVVRGEFWIQTNCWVVKGIASAANIYGKRIVEMEAFTTGHHWQDGPLDYKVVADRALCEGANRFVIHTFPHIPPEAGTPGWGYYAGVHFNPKLTWWPKARPMVDYLARSSYLLQQGRFVGDVCYYYGGQAPNKIPPRHIDPSLGFGYDYDVVNPEILLAGMGTEGDRIALASGMRYELLVLPNRADIDLEVLQKIQSLVRQGATVVGRKPVRSAGLSDYRRRDRQVRDLADKLWGPCDGKTVLEHAYGRGRVIWGRPLREILRQRGVGPDFAVPGQAEEAGLDYIHRRTEETDIYFVRNKTGQPVAADCVFRVSGKAPELWSPGDGHIRPQLVYREEPGGTRLPLRLPAYGSVFVVFRRPADDSHVVAIGRNGKPLFPAPPPSSPTDHPIPPPKVLPRGDRLSLVAEKAGTYLLKTAAGEKLAGRADSDLAARQVTGPWEIRFPKDLGAPESKTLGGLGSWTDDPEPGVKYFSGTATYRTTFDLPADALGQGRFLTLDLGDVRVTADVRLNGQPLGILWHPPFRVDISDAARAGRNELCIEVTNVWRNRLIGDLQLPKEKRICRTNLFGKISPRAPLIPSGLLGPVRLEFGKTVEVAY